jgi:hypothetical protein
MIMGHAVVWTRRSAAVAIAVALLTFAALTPRTSADVLFSTRGSGPITDANHIFVSDPAIPGATLEDANLVGIGPLSIGSVRLGYYNDSSAPVNLDALVTFFDTVDYNVAANAPIAASQIGSTYRINFTAEPGVILGFPYNWGETGLLSLPGGPLSLPDSSIGVMLRFVDANTNVTNATVLPTYHDVVTPPTMIGTSDDLFAADFNGDGLIVGEEVGTWFAPDDPDTPFYDGLPPANLYIELNSTAPEPGSLAFLAISVAGMRRRRVGQARDGQEQTVPRIT